MSLISEVQALTNATTELLTVVHDSKEELDGAVAVAVAAQAVATEAIEAADQVALDAAAVASAASATTTNSSAALAARTAAEAASAAAVLARDAALLSVATDYQTLTLTALNAVTGMTNGQTAFVVESGRFYSYSGSAWADQGPVFFGVATNERVSNFDYRTGFVSGEVDGPYGADLVTPSATPTYAVTAGELVIAAPAATSFIRTFWTGRRRNAESALELVAEFEFDDLATASGPFVGIGDDNIVFRGIYWVSTGSVVVANTSGSAVSGQPTVATDPSLVLSAGDVGRLFVRIEPDGTGYAIATKVSTGYSRRLNFTGIPIGKIWAVWRRSQPGKIKRFSIAQRVEESTARSLAKLATEAAASVPTLDGLDGMYAAANGAASSQAKLIAESGVVKISSASTALLFARTNIQRASGQAMEIDLTAQIDTLGASASGAIVGIGDVESTRTLAGYLHNGVVGTLVSSTNLVGVGGVVSGMEFVAGSVVRVRLCVYEDNTGLIEAFGPSGQYASQAITGVPGGPVLIGWRNTAIGKLLKFTALSVPGGLGRRVRALENAAPASTPTLLAMHLMPDSTPSRNPKGFTCTGLDRITRGTYAGCWLVGDDGRLTEASPGSYAPAVHVLTPDFRSILQTFAMPYSGHSVQGVAVDTSGDADTFWVSTAGDRKLRHFDMTGAEIGGDVFDWHAAGYINNPNGLAYDPVNDALWAGESLTATVRLVSCNPSASPRLLDTITLAAVDSQDQFHYDSARTLLYYTQGSNGVDGSIRSYNTTTDLDSAVYSGLSRAQAIEGMYIDRAARTLTIVNDGGFHTAAQPALNIALQYSVPLIG